MIDRSGSLVVDDDTASSNDTSAHPSEKMVSRALRGMRPWPPFAWLTVFVVPAALQLVYGTHDVGLVEEWGVEQLFDSRGTVFWTPLVNASTPGLPSQAIRPLTVAPHSLAFLLDSDSFTWYHLLNALALGLKGVAMFALLLRLRARLSVAAMGGIVFALFPAWTGLFTFRMLHTQFALAAFVFAISEFVAYSRRPSVARAIMVCAGLAVSLLLYEVAYVAIVLVPLLTMVDGRCSFRRFVRLAAIWFTVPVINGVRIIFVLKSDGPLYQRDLVTTGPRKPVEEFVDLLDLVYTRGLSGLLHGPMGMSASGWVVIITAPVVVMLLMTVWADANGTAGETDKLDAEPLDGRLEAEVKPSLHVPTNRALILLTVGSLLAAPIVCLIYAPNAILLADPLRVFSIASVPLAIGTAALVELLARHYRLAGTVAALALLLGTL